MKPPAPGTWRAPRPREVGALWGPGKGDADPALCPRGLGLPARHPRPTAAHPLPSAPTGHVAPSGSSSTCLGVSRHSCGRGEPRAVERGLPLLRTPCSSPHLCTGRLQTEKPAFGGSRASDQLRLLAASPEGQGPHSALGRKGEAPRPGPRPCGGWAGSTSREGQLHAASCPHPRPTRRFTPAPASTPAHRPAPRAAPRGPLPAAQAPPQGPQTEPGAHTAG